MADPMGKRGAETVKPKPLRPELLAAIAAYDAEVLAATHAYDSAVRPIRDRYARRLWRADRDYEVEVKPFARKWGERVARARADLERAHRLRGPSAAVPPSK